MYQDVNEWFTSFLFETFSSKQSKCERCLKYWINARFANVEFRSPFQFYLVLKSQATRAIKIATIVFHTLKNLFVAQFVIYSITSNFCNQVILKVIAIVIDLVRAFTYPALDQGTSIRKKHQHFGSGFNRRVQCALQRDELNL